MLRWLVLLTLVGCDASRAPAPADPVRWTRPPPPVAWLAPSRGRIGRAQAPEVARGLGLTGDVDAPLALPTPWAVPGGGPARAIVYGLDDARPAVELVDVDTGRIAWRDNAACAGPVVGVTDLVAVCADARGTHAIGLDARPRWSVTAPFLAMTDDRVVTAGAGEAIVIDASSGSELARVALPAGITVDSIVASCGDSGRELFAAGEDGTLARIAEVKGAPARTWATSIGGFAAIDACTGDTVLVTAVGDAGAELVAIARATGHVTGRAPGVRGFWPARDGTDALEIATADGVARWPRDLATPGAALPLPPLRELLATRGDRRLVRATPLTAALLDGAGVRAYLPLAELGAVLGDGAILAGSWRGAPGLEPRRVAIPPPYRRVLRIAPRPPPVAVPAPLRDLPEVAPLPVAGAIAAPGIDAHEIAAIALDPADPRALYAATDGGVVARLDLAARAWTWQRAGGCGPGDVVGLAVARGVIACAARAPDGASLRATGADGRPRWERRFPSLDVVTAAGDVVLARDADRLDVLDARDGHLRGALASDDGAPVRAAALDLAGEALVVAYQRGRVVAHAADVELAPVWSVEVAGAVRALTAAGDGVLVELDDGDAYRLAGATGAAVALPGLGLVWRAAGDVITGEAPGGPIPPATMPVMPKPPRRPPPRHVDPDQPAPPPIATPWVVPGPLAASWQNTLYELTGGVRARNDYALAPPVAPAGARGPAGGPLVVAYGPGLREVLVIDAATGDPLRRFALPEGASPGKLFSTVVDGRPIAGAILAGPLRAVLF